MQTARPQGILIRTNAEDCSSSGDPGQDWTLVFFPLGMELVHTLWVKDQNMFKFSIASDSELSKWNSQPFPGLHPSFHSFLHPLCIECFFEPGFVPYTVDTEMKMTQSCHPETPILGRRELFL